MNVYNRTGRVISESGEEAGKRWLEEERQHSVLAILNLR